MQVTDQYRFIHLQQTAIRRNQMGLHGITADISVRFKPIPI